MKKNKQEVYTDLERPGIEGEDFTITFSSDSLAPDFIIGEDLEILESHREGDLYKIEFKAISEKAINYFKTIKNGTGS